jgi:hypothetical protein
MSMTIWLRLEVTMENEIKNLEILESENVMIQIEAINQLFIKDKNLENKL